MTDKNDWRLTNQMNYLYKKQLIHTHYIPYREGWEHDHCAFCTEEINSLSPAAYCTPDRYHWICDSCYRDFRGMFQWKVVKD